MVIREHMEVIGADGVHVGTVDSIAGGRIRLRKKEGGEGAHKGQDRYIKRSIVAELEGNKVRLCVSASEAVTIEPEKLGTSI